jgi:hypothetical protein
VSEGLRTVFRNTRRKAGSLTNLRVSYQESGTRQDSAGRMGPPSPGRKERRGRRAHPSCGGMVSTAAHLIAVREKIEWTQEEIRSPLEHQWDNGCVCGCHPHDARLSYFQAVKRRPSLRRGIVSGGSLSRRPRLRKTQSVLACPVDFLLEVPGSCHAVAGVWFAHWQIRDLHTLYGQ